MTSQGFYQEMNLEELKALPYPFARICLYLYDVDTKTKEEIYRCRGEAVTVGQLCQLIDALPGQQSYHWQCQLSDQSLDC